MLDQYWHRLPHKGTEGYLRIRENGLYDGGKVYGWVKGFRKLGKETGEGAVKSIKLE